MKRIIILALLCSLIVTPIQTYAISEKQDTKKEQYVVISNNGKSRNVETYSMTSAEALKLRQDSKVLVVEKDEYVFGSMIDINNFKDKDKDKDKDKNKDKKFKKIKKDKHNKKIKKRSSKNSNVEWNIQAIKADSVDTISGSAITVDLGSKVKVAIIDSGVDYTEDIDVYMRKNFIPGEDEVSIIYEDSCGHGTSVAGIIAAKGSEDGFKGINPNVELYSAKVLDSNLSAPISRVVEAIYWAIDNEVNIINISFGTATDSDALKLAIQDAYAAGILLIAAAGNNLTIEYPAAYDEVIAVGSVDSMGERSQYSATGEDLELMAPGELILSTSHFGGFTVSSGTSMAAPHVTGIASILWQKDISSSNDFIRNLLDLSANKYGDSVEYGYGLIDLEYALGQYDEFKNLYVDNEQLDSIIEEEKRNGGLLDNTSEVIAFDDVDYVKGSWTQSSHDSYAEAKSPSGQTLSPDALTVVKLGAIAPDKLIPIHTTNPQWHGYGNCQEKQTDGTYKNLYYSNYMGSYIYITKMALVFNNNTSVVTGT